MLFVADVAFTSDIQASGRVSAPTMCVHSISENIINTLKSLIRKIILHSQSVHIIPRDFHISLANKRPVTFFKNNFPSCAFLNSHEKISSLSVGTVWMMGENLILLFNTY